MKRENLKFMLQNFSNISVKLEDCFKHFGTGKSTFYLGYEGQKIENTFETFKKYSLERKEKKALSEFICILHNFSNI